MSKRGTLVLSAALLGITAVTPALAQTAVNNSWLSPVSGDWFIPSNWSQNAVPNNGTPSTTKYNVYVDREGSYTVTFDQTATVDSLNLGGSGSTTLAMSGGTLTVVNSSGLKMSGNSHIVHSGGALKVNDSIELTGTSTYDLTGGSLTVNSGVTQISLGFTSADAPELNVSGNGRLFANILNIGTERGSGAVMQDGGTVTINGSTPQLIVGSGTMGFGSYNLSGGTLLAGSEYIGLHGVGTLAQTGGTNRHYLPSASTSYLTAGNDARSKGTYSISGTSIVDLGGMTLGSSGFGTLSIASGTVSLGTMILGDHADGVGFANVDGGSFATSGLTTVGRLGIGTVLQSGGSARFDGGILLAANADNVSISAGTFTQTGGTLTAASLTVSGGGDGLWSSSGMVTIAGPVINNAGTLGSGQVLINGGTFTSNSFQNDSKLAIAGPGQTALGPLAGSGTTTITGNAAVNAASISQTSLSLAGVSIVSVDANGGALSRLGRLSIDSTAAFNLADNDVIVGSGTARSRIEGYVRNARDGGQWDRSGLTTTTARPTGAALKPTGLGVVSGDEYTGTGQSTFDGVSVNATDTLVKYTWNGDADLNGRITADDYSHIDSGFQTQQSAGFVYDWFHGDFDYSGRIDANDYALIDSTYQQQSGTLREAITALETGVMPTGDLPDSLQQVVNHYGEFGQSYADRFIFASVPEPALSLLLCGASVMYRRRRCR